MTIPRSNGKTVLISGINGYIASSIGLEFLKKGYTLRGTARATKGMETLQRGAYEEYGDRFEMRAVPDITVPGAFDDAVKGVNSIIHVASPIDFSLNKYDLFVPPAVNGSIGILTSALNHAGPQLESVVQTSTIGTLSNFTEPTPYTFTEADWSEGVEDEARKLGDSAPAPLLYLASKVASERAVWRFQDEHKPPFSISTVQPALVMGPPAQLAASPENLNFTLAPIWAIFSGAATEIPPDLVTNAWVDIRDVADIHIWCAEHPAEASGQRYIAANGQGPPQAIADILRKAYPDRKMIPVGNPGSGYDDAYGYPEDGYIFDSSKMVKTLGRPLIRFEQSILDTARVFERYL